MSSELDALVAEKVMGISLVPPRELAMARVGARYVTSTGPVFLLTTGEDLPMSYGADLRAPEGSDYWNDRYYLYVAEHLGDRIKDEVDAYRLSPEPYSTDIAAAWTVLGRFPKVIVERDGAAWYAQVSHIRDGDHWEWYAAEGISAPEAICRATLLAVGGQS